MAEPVWDDEAGEWVYPEDDGSEELEDTPGEALWRQKQQDARDRDIRRRNALAGNPDPRYAHEFEDLYPPDDPQTETGTGTPGTTGNPPMPPPPTPPTPPTPTPVNPTNDTPDPDNASNDKGKGAIINGKYYTPDELRDMGLRTGGAAGGVDPDYAAHPERHPQTPAQAAFVWEKYREQLRVARAKVAAGTLDESELAAYEEAARDAVSWDRQLRAGLGENPLDHSKGRLDDLGSDLEGIVRNRRYSGGPKSAADLVAEAVARNVQRMQSGGDRTKGGYDTNWNDEDPSRLGGGDAPAGYTREMERLESQLNVPGITPAQRNDIRMKQAAMFNGAYPETSASVSTLGAITNTAENPSQTQPAAPPVPYSARSSSAVTPYNTGSYSAAPTPPTAPAGMPTTMGNILTNPMPTTPYGGQDSYGGQDPYAANRQFDYTNNVYDRSLQGTGFARAPWKGTRDRLARGPMSPPSTDASTGMPSQQDRRRAYRFGAQNATGNGRDAMLGERDFNGQMNNWLKAYDDWNRRGTDPFAPQTGGA